jgi:type II secretory pathway pseudopilin PulG
MLKITDKNQESGMSLIAVMAIMAIMAVAFLAVAPSIQQSVQREKELESIRRGEEIAEAIRQYIDFNRGRKLPDSIDELLEGLPQGTKKRQILRPSAAVDPLSEDGKWRLIRVDRDEIVDFGKRVRAYNNGTLPAHASNTLNRFAARITSQINADITETTDVSDLDDDDDFEVTTENTPFIGVASQSRNNSVIAYYGIEKHSQWIFTPLFRGSGTSSIQNNSNTNQATDTR